jgi:hypothetical protein
MHSRISAAQLSRQENDSQAAVVENFFAGGWNQRDAIMAAESAGSGQLMTRARKRPALSRHADLSLQLKFIVPPAAQLAGSVDPSLPLDERHSDVESFNFCALEPKNASNKYFITLPKACKIVIALTI